MEEARAPKFNCSICHQQKMAGQLTPGELIPDSVADVIRQEHPDWNSDQPMCRDCLSLARMRRAQNILQADKGKLSELDMEVIHNIGARGLLSANPNDVFNRSQTWGERLADRVAISVGSWVFATAIFLFLAGWVGLNILFQPFQPYPVIILAMISAVLASLAAIQGPIILMSQRRQAKLDRLRAENDYRLNLKAELEIRYLSEELEHFFKVQQRRSLRIKQDEWIRG